MPFLGCSFKRLRRWILLWVVEQAAASLVHTVAGVIRTRKQRRAQAQQHQEQLRQQHEDVPTNEAVDGVHGSIPGAGSGLGSGAGAGAGNAAGAGSGPAFLLVCDLNETLVGDDSSTSSFKRFWEDVGIVRGGVLVYNTGRSLQETECMMRDKGHCLPQPAALICSLGTRIYWPGPCEAQGQCQWQEDVAWTATTSAGWSTEAVKQTCDHLLRSDLQLREGMQLQSAEESKVSCSVSCSLMEVARSRVLLALRSNNLEALAICSGQGDKRSLTLVPVTAGKLAAQEYVRRHYKLQHSSTVSCGDSGNDLLMLSGSNPAIIVGNAEPDLIEWAMQQQAAHPEQLGPTGRHRIYLAQGHEALGVIEGLQQLGYE